MTCQLLLDNWLLQDVSHAMRHGLSRDSGSHSYESIPAAAIQIECLLNFLADIVTRDILVVDEQFAYAWENTYLPLLRLEDKNILSIQKFNTKDDRFLDIRKFVANDLCSTKSLEQAHKENEESWDREKRTAHHFLSQILWGTAGNIARSSMINAPYSPHPSRRHLLEQTTFMPSRPDAVESTMEFIRQTRVNLFEEVRQRLKIRTTQIVLPPLAVEIIESSSSTDDLFKVALQVRNDYKGFRKYMNKYQEALDSENPREMLVFKEVFDYICAKARTNSKGQEKYGDLTISMGVGFINFKKSVPKFD
ncbi:MAG: hypothetical protein N3I35_12415 [Clostridia bacterium]|nr:hypothetical protein [Clostridia bacterium]